MTELAAQNQNSGIAGPVVLILLIIGGVIYGTGYAMAVMRRANKDYKSTKAAVPVLRKGFWLALWAVIKVGFWVAIAGLVLVAWMIRDVRGKEADAGTQPSPSASSPAKRR